MLHILSPMYFFLWGSCFFPLSSSDGLSTVTLVGIIVGVLLAIGFIGAIIVVVMRKMSGRYSEVNSLHPCDRQMKAIVSRTQIFELIEISDISWVWWLVPVVSAAGQLQTSLGNIVRPCLKKIISGTMVMFQSSLLGPLECSGSHLESQCFERLRRQEVHLCPGI
uniref:Isoform 2 of Podoplanin n=1 Tax=Homo sapiens TaxID=9606 RepID=Q86YL7-2